MANPYVRETDRTEDLDGMPVIVGVDHDAVTLSLGGVTKAMLGRTACEEFARAFVAAVWEASDNSRLMAEEASDELGPVHRAIHPRTAW